MPAVAVRTLEEQLSREGTLAVVGSLAEAGTLAEAGSLAGEGRQPAEEGSQLAGAGRVVDSRSWFSTSASSTCPCTGGRKNLRLVSPKLLPLSRARDAAASLASLTHYCACANVNVRHTQDDVVRVR